MYALRLDSNSRVLEVMDIRYRTEETPVVDSYPEGLIYDYRYVNGKWIYDPVSVPSQPESSASVWDDLAAAIREGVNSV